MTVLTMTCDEARAKLSVLSRDGMRLTEWALADAHRRRCAECREALDSPQPRVRAAQQVAPHRIVRRSSATSIEAIRSAVTRFASWMIRVVSTGGVLTRVPGMLLPALAVMFGRATARRMGSALEAFAHRLTWCRSLLQGVSHWSAEGAIRVWGSGTRRVGRTSASAAGASRVVIALAGRSIAGGCTGARRVLTGFVALGVRAATKAIGLSARVGLLARPIDRSLFQRVVHRSLWADRRPLYTGLVCLGVIIATALFLWPGWPIHSTPQWLSQQDPQATDSRPADLGTARTLDPSTADTSRPRDGLAVEPTTRRVAIPPSLPEAQAVIPTPARRRAPSPAREPASAPVSASLDGPWARESSRTPQTGVQQSETPDASAAIDWLLSRRGSVPR